MILFYSLGGPDNILGIMAYLRDVKLIKGHSVFYQLIQLLKAEKVSDA